MLPYLQLLVHSLGSLIHYFIHWFMNQVQTWCCLFGCARSPWSWGWNILLHIHTSSTLKFSASCKIKYQPHCFQKPCLSTVHSPKSVVQPYCQIQTESFISVNVLFFSVKFELRGQKKPFEMNQSSFSSVLVTEGKRSRTPSKVLSCFFMKYR